MLCCRARHPRAGAPRTATAPTRASGQRIRGECGGSGFLTFFSPARSRSRDRLAPMRPCARALVRSSGRRHRWHRSALLGTAHCSSSRRASLSHATTAPRTHPQRARYSLQRTAHGPACAHAAGRQSRGGDQRTQRPAPRWAGAGLRSHGTEVSQPLLAARTAPCTEITGRRRGRRGDQRTPRPLDPSRAASTSTASSTLSPLLSTPLVPSLCPLFALSLYHSLSYHLSLP